MKETICLFVILAGMATGLPGSRQSYTPLIAAASGAALQGESSVLDSIQIALPGETCSSGSCGSGRCSASKRGKKQPGKARSRRPSRRLIGFRFLRRR